MAAALVYTLPTLQLVCHLVATGNSTIIGITPGTIARSSNPLPTLLTGYVAFPNFGVAYKIYRELLPWIQAKAKCAEEGGHLADVDSSEKVQVFYNFPGDKVRNMTYTGIHMIDNVWRSDRTGFPVSNLPWAPGEPNGDGSCAVMGSENGCRLGRYSCDLPRQFVCQIRYLWS